jgi:hypothetical protein|tara:strand:- start:1938 stop:3224 length:1287 start_codon:yes stop_codon:yes gene_type:complete
MNLEYVISGLTMGASDLYHSPQVSAPYIDHFNSKINSMNTKYSNQNISLLHNALTERKHGITMRQTMPTSWHRHFADSGGLQLARTPKKNTPEVRDAIYRHQAEHSDVAMIFDEIPIEYDLSMVGGNSMKATIEGRRFIRDDVRKTAEATRDNVKRQIEIFKEMGSSTKVMLISQGQDVDSWRKYIEVICAGLDDEEIEQMCTGISLGSQCNGNHFAHRMEMIYSAREYQVPDSLRKNIHLLGVGNPNALMPFIVSPDYFDFIDNLSYDSSSHASSWFFSRYRDKNYNQITLEAPFRTQKLLSDIVQNDLTPVIEDILNDHKEAFGEFGITTAQQVIDESTKWSIHNIEKDRGFIRPGGEHAYQLLIWYWVTNTVQHFMDEIDRRIQNPHDETGLSTITSYDEFITRWLPRQRAPSKVPEYWPTRLDV